MTVRIGIALLLLAGAANAAGPLQIEGNYRFGHEVNIVCTGLPEACYWLVDTAADVRRQLEQQAASVAPYTPICLRLVAEISEDKTDGFGLDYDGSIRVLELRGLCNPDSAAKSLRIEDLQHRRWELQRIDGVELAQFAAQLGFEADAAKSKVPDLDFGEQGFVSGNTGCNQFHGQAKVVDNSLILSRLATTARACEGFAGELELQLQLIYRNPLALTRDGNDLILDAVDRRLHFRLRDRVQ